VGRVGIGVMASWGWKVEGQDQLGALADVQDTETRSLRTSTPPLKLIGSGEPE
jgi:hypothetical protein